MELKKYVRRRKFLSTIRVYDKKKSTFNYGITVWSRENLKAKSCLRRKSALECVNI